MAQRRSRLGSGAAGFAGRLADVRMGAVRVSRRVVLGAGFAAAAGLAGCGHRNAARATPRNLAASEPTGSTPAPVGTDPPAGASPSSASGRTPTPGGQVLAAPYSARLVEVLRRYLTPTSDNPKHPGYAGAVVLVMVNGTITTLASVGYAVRYGAGPVDLPESKRVAMRSDSIFDVASVTKLYTAIAALQQVDRGRIDLAAPVVSYLPAFDGPGKSAVTVSMLLAHTSEVGGLTIAATNALPDVAARWAAFESVPLIAGATPGSIFRYSGVGLLLVQRIVEKVTGRPLDQVVRADITGPLGLRDTGFNPLKWLSPADRAGRLVATDARSSRGLLRGEVHDQITHALGGVSGAAGVFATAADLAVIGQMLLDGGRYGGGRLLAEATARPRPVDQPGAPELGVGQPRSDPSGRGQRTRRRDPDAISRRSSRSRRGRSDMTAWVEMNGDWRSHAVMLVATVVARRPTRSGQSVVLRPASHTQTPRRPTRRAAADVDQHALLVDRAASGAHERAARAWPSAKRPKRRADLGREQLRLLPRGEVPAKYSRARASCPH